MNTHRCSRCGRELGKENVRETRWGNETYCCRCADWYDNRDWDKVWKLELKRMAEG